MPPDYPLSPHPLIPPRITPTSPYHTTTITHHRGGRTGLHPLITLFYRSPEKGPEWRPRPGTGRPVGLGGEHPRGNRLVQALFDWEMVDGEGYGLVFVGVHDPLPRRGSLLTARLITARFAVYAERIGEPKRMG